MLALPFDFYHCQLLHFGFGNGVIFAVHSNNVNMPIQNQLNDMKIISIFDHFRWLPFDWKTPFGYLVAWLAQFAAHIALNTSVIPFFIQMFSTSWLFASIIDDLTNELVAFNNDIKTSRGKKHEKLKQDFCKIIRLYSHAKE